MKTSYGKITLLAFFILLAFLLLAPMRAGEEDSMLLSPEVLKMSVGDSYVIKCALASDDLNQRIKFESADPRIASISSDGTVHAIASGETTIAASASGGAEAAMRVIVAGTPMRELTLNAHELHIEKGEISGLSADYNSDASDARLQWISSDESVARVSANGRVLGVSGGEADITVLSANGLTDTARVYVNVVGTAVHITPYELLLGVGAEIEMKVSYLPIDSTDAVKRWSSSDASVAYVDADNVLHAVGRGSAYISVRTEDGLTSGMEITVERAPRNIQLEPSRATVERGDVLNMQMIQYDATGAEERLEHPVTWTSDNERVATVDQNGVVTALSGGVARISVASDGLTAECELTVRVSVLGLELDQTEVYLLKEETAQPIQLAWTITPADADDPTVTFASDNEQVASVDADGLVTMTGGYGTAVITASSANGAQAEFIVNVVTELPEADEADEADSFGSIEELEADVRSDAQPTRSAQDAQMVQSTQSVQSAATAAPAQESEPVFGAIADGFVSYEANVTDTGDYEGENIY